VAYPALLDSLHLRLHRMREMLKKHMGSGEDVAVGQAWPAPLRTALPAVLREHTRHRY
jgi:hypothetical protein